MDDILLLDNQDDFIVNDNLGSSDNFLSSESDPEESEDNIETISNNTLSVNNVYDDKLDTIINNQEEINDNVLRIVQDLQRFDFSSGVSDQYVSDNSVVNISVSDNIIYKPINEYSVSESLNLLLLLSVFVVCFVHLINRSVLK